LSSKLINCVKQKIYEKVNPCLVEIDLNKPIVSFSFDDFPRSAIQNGAKLLESLNAKGTFFASLELIDTKNQFDFLFTKDDLLYLESIGHEIGSHGFKHLDSRTLNTEDFLEDLKTTQIKAAEIIEKKFNLYSYPFGQLNRRIKKVMPAEFLACRGIFPGINHGKTDLCLLKSEPLYGTIKKLPHVKKLIESCFEKKGWLIFYTHDVQNQPSPWGCTNELLKATIELCIKHQCSIMPIGEAVSFLKSKRKTPLI
jgi:peptidoglycan/xylan/chitin deacetylase (PgdA/CDA1 family)